jgi:hypothetical protein
MVLASVEKLHYQGLKSLLFIQEHHHHHQLLFLSTNLNSIFSRAHTVVPLSIKKSFLPYKDGKEVKIVVNMKNNIII